MVDRVLGSREVREDSTGTPYRTCGPKKKSTLTDEAAEERDALAVRVIDLLTDQQVICALKRASSWWSCPGGSTRQTLH